MNIIGRKHTGVDFNIFDVERIEITPLSGDLDRNTFTRTIKVKNNGRWTWLTLYGKDRKATKIHEVNVWEH